MNTVTGTWKNGQIILDGQVDWPEGCELVVTPMANGTLKIGIDESEWRDDPESLAHWDAWIKTIVPLEYTPEEEALFARFDEEMRRHNVEAVRRQMGEEPLP